MLIIESYFRFEELIIDLGIRGTGDKREDGSEYTEPTQGPWSNQFLGNIHRMRAFCRGKLHEFTMKKLDL
jgi:hypothetical protein